MQVIIENNFKDMYNIFREHYVYMKDRLKVEDTLYEVGSIKSINHLDLNLSTKNRMINIFSLGCSADLRNILQVGFNPFKTLLLLLSPEQNLSRITVLCEDNRNIESYIYLNKYFDNRVNIKVGNIEKSITSLVTDSYLKFNFIMVDNVDNIGNPYDKILRLSYYLSDKNTVILCEFAVSHLADLRRHKIIRIIDTYLFVDVEQNYIKYNF